MDSAGIKNYNIPKIAKSLTHKLSADKLSSTFSQFDIDNINFWESHERLVFKIYNKQKLDRQFASYLLAIYDAFRHLAMNPDGVVLIQELGGFISVLASMFVARKLSIDVYFMEPAFFKGRLFTLKNTLCAPYISPVFEGQISQELRDYIRCAVSGQSIVVPEKDKHHYNKAVRKLANISNLKRLMQKLIDQYIYKRHQEFGHNWVYVGLHVKMFINALRLRGKYSSLSECEEFVYFPFHVPNDVAITLRSPEYLDQLAFVEFLVRTIPSGLNVAVKEHPAMIGAIDCIRLKAMLKKYDNLKLIAPSTNNYNVLSKASAVVTINSKSGAEAAMLGKPIFVLGNAFYENSPLVNRIQSLRDLPEAIKNIKSVSADEKVESYFQGVWNQTSEGELYVNDPVNIKNIARTLINIGSA
ncbi:MAG: capsule biosynthesis protein [Proteobacteria bacterium]|nr:capsule biosynthesis protein [Pseudomonadota bacterium]